MLPNIICIDFDGTLFEHMFPSIGEPILDKDGHSIIDKIRAYQSNGWYIILWTCREGELLENAIKESAKYGLVFDAVNENHPDAYLAFSFSKGYVPRKVYANWYIDDKSINVEDF